MAQIWPSTTSLPFFGCQKKPFYAECIIIFALNPHLWPKIPWSAQWGRVGHLLPPVNTCTSEREALIFLKYLLQSKLIIYQQSLPVIICHLLSLNIQNKTKNQKREHNFPPPQPVLNPQGIPSHPLDRRLSCRGLHSQLFTKLKQLVEPMHGILVSWTRPRFVCSFFFEIKGGVFRVHINDCGFVKYMYISKTSCMDYYYHYHINYIIYS